MDANIQRGYVWQERDLHGPDDVVYAPYSIDSDEDSSGDEGKGKEGFVVHKAAKKLAKQEKAARAAAAAGLHDEEPKPKTEWWQDVKAAGLHARTPAPASSGGIEPPAFAVRDPYPRRYDMVVLGATGFTGRYVLMEMAMSTVGQRWAAAGRNKSKVKEVVDELGLVDVDVLQADIQDRAALVALCKETVVLLNCTGPFRFLGAAVVEACLTGGCHYVDITGEPEFMLRSQLSFDERARDRMLLVVHACGFDSVPADEGARFAAEQLEAGGGACATVESVLALRAGRAGLAVHATTLECAVHGFAAAGELRALRAQLRAAGPAAGEPAALPPAGAPLPVAEARWEARVPGGGAFVVKMPMADASVVRRSAALRSARTQVPPPQYAAYVATGAGGLESGLTLARLAIQGGVALTFATALGEWGRETLLAHPGAFTAGVFTREGPSQDQINETSFAMHFFARGWRAGVPAGGAAPPPGPDVEVECRVTGPEPGYVATSRMLVAAALTVLEEGHRQRSLTYMGGVLPPAEAFSGSRFRQRIAARGIAFEVVARRDIAAASDPLSA